MMVYPHDRKWTIIDDFGVFIARHARRYRTSQTAIIAALLPIISSEMVIGRIPNVSGPDKPITPVSVIAPNSPPAADHIKQIDFFDALPRTASGKVQKHLIPASNTSST